MIIFDKQRDKVKKKLLGEILTKRKIISNEQLEKALNIQKKEKR